MIRACIAALVFAGVCTHAMAETSASDARSETAAALRDRALHDPLAYELVRSLATEVGARPAGSPAAAKARDWAVAQLARLGFQNIQVEPFEVTAWTRGREEAEILPSRERLVVLGLGGAAPTPAGGVEGEIAVFHNFAELTAAPAGSLAGAAVSSAKLWKTAISPSTPPAGVGAAPPRPRMVSRSRPGATISASSRPRVQAVTSKGSTWMFWNPRRVSWATAQSRALAAAGEPAGRAPTSVASERTSS